MNKMNSRTEELHTLMREHGKNAQEVGELLGRTPQTVRVWRSATDDRVIPQHTLELLRLKLERGAA